jgi:AraC family transcriptional regulator
MTMTQASTARIEHLAGKKLIGQKAKMSFANNATQKLWQGFMPRRKEIENSAGNNLYSLEVYPDVNFFQRFDPSGIFEKWAALEIKGPGTIPPGMEMLILPPGLYAVFDYRGLPSEAADFYRTIFTQWLPASEYILDNRPHFALMGEHYKRDDPSSREEIWIPVKSK